LLNFIDDVPSLLRASDLGVLSTHREGIPNGVLEPMAAGLPVVATRLPGTVEALGDATWTALPGSSDDLARTLRTLCLDKTLRESVGTANRARIRKEFDAERNATRFASLLIAPKKDS